MTAGVDPPLLGCAESYTVQVGDRCGTLIADLGRTTDLRWERTLNDVSTAEIQVDSNSRCCDIASNLVPWFHTVTVIHDGATVWGPGLVTEPAVGSSGVTVNAADTAYPLTARVPHTNLTHPARTSLQAVAAWLIRDGMRPDNPCGLVPRIVNEPAEPDTGPRAYRKDRGYITDHLDTLTQSGLLWTAVGQQIWLFNTPIGTLPVLLGSDDVGDGFESRTLGSEFATRGIVYGENGVEGVAGGVDPVFGLVEKIREDTSAASNYAAHRAAEALVVSEPPVVGRSTGDAALSPRIPVDINDLVPGVLVPVSLTVGCREVVGNLRLSRLTVNLASGVETVSADVSTSTLDASHTAGLDGVLNQLARRIRQLEAR